MRILRRNRCGSHRIGGGIAHGGKEIVAAIQRSAEAFFGQIHPVFVEGRQGHPVGQIPLRISPKALAQIGQLPGEPGNGPGVVDLPVHVHIQLHAVDVEGIHQHHPGLLGPQGILDKEQGGIQLLPVAAVVVAADALGFIQLHRVQPQPHMAGAEGHDFQTVFRHLVKGMDGIDRGIRIHRPQKHAQKVDTQPHQQRHRQKARQKASVLFHGLPS